MLLKVAFNIIRALNLLDSYLERKIKQFILKPHYVISGGCLQCASCCELIGCEVSKHLTNTFILKVIIVFIQHLNDFRFSHFIKEKNMLLFTCNNFDSQNRKCLCYKTRPAICRNYPFSRYFAKPVLMPGCGYHVRARREIC